MLTAMSTPATIACRSFDSGLDKAYEHITLKKIPQMLLSRCEFGKADYLNCYWQESWKQITMCRTGFVQPLTNLVLYGKITIFSS